MSFIAKKEEKKCIGVEMSRRLKGIELNEMNDKVQAAHQETNSTTYFWFGLVFFYEQSGGVVR